MRQFAATGLRLWNLPREAKLVYTFFCALSLAALAVSVLLYEDLVGPSLRSGSLQRVQRYYGGPEMESAHAPAPAQGDVPAGPAGGPEIALPADEGPVLTMAMPYRKLLEVTHFHLFTVPVFLLIISHLFMLGGLSPPAKRAWIGAGWGSATLHLLAPWLVRYGGPRLGFLFPLSGAALLVTSGMLTVYPAVSMWRRPRAAPRPTPTDNPGDEEEPA